MKLEEDRIIREKKTIEKMIEIYKTISRKKFYFTIDFDNAIIYN